MEGKLGLIENLKKRAADLKTETYALYLAYQDQRTPWYAKAFAGVVIAYAFSPIDLIPDFIPVLGYLDDLVLVPLGIALALKMIPVEIMAECREKAREVNRSGKPNNWFAAAIIVLSWLLIAFFSVCWFIQLIRE
jgi:uncharacterized membrane protein YkvA (DUF1232 family)